MQYLAGQHDCSVSWVILNGFDDGATDTARATSDRDVDHFRLWMVLSFEV